ncbi:MAG: 5-oxoprolinase subunit PxpB [Gemmatimonadaceae bacterium]
MIQYTPLGDSAITVALGEGISRSLSADVLRVAEGLRAASLRGVTEIVAAYATLGVFYDPLRVNFDQLRDQLRPIVEQSRDSQTTASNSPARMIRIPVWYNGEDLAEVAERTEHTVDEVIELHSAREYHVYVIGFVPGFAYLGEIDPSLILPRRSTPRKRVPAGSVGIAEAQTGVYPFETPGGWNLIGRTDTKMFDAERAEPALLKVGDRVVFERRS